MEIKDLLKMADGKHIRSIRGSIYKSHCLEVWNGHCVERIIVSSGLSIDRRIGSRLALIVRGVNNTYGYPDHDDRTNQENKPASLS